MGFGLGDNTFTTTSSTIILHTLLMSSTAKLCNDNLFITEKRLVVYKSNQSNLTILDMVSNTLFQISPTQSRVCDFVYRLVPTPPRVCAFAHLLVLTPPRVCTFAHLLALTPPRVCTFGRPFVLTPLRVFTFGHLLVLT